MPGSADQDQRRRPALRVYIAEHCSICREALRIVERIRSQFSGIDVQLIDLGSERGDNRDGVFSVPTYVLDGRTVSLGNPDADALARQLEQRLSPKDHE